VSDISPGKYLTTKADEDILYVYGIPGSIVIAILEA